MGTVHVPNRGRTVACSLPDAEVGDRVTSWRALRERAGLGAEAIDGGARLWLSRDSAAEAEDLLRREAACCGFLDFTLAPDGDRLRLDVTSPAPGGDRVAALLAGLGVAEPPGC